MNAQAPIHKNISLRWLEHTNNFLLAIWTTAIAVSLVFGWLYRDEGYLSADSGLGYWLGIIGCSLMLLLLTYSLRKRFRFMRKVLPIKLWFQLHMTLGVVGPLCIIFHSNFHLGSFNSIVALVCMLLVAGSGLIGRYIYNRLHFGLYGERIRLKQALADVKSICHELSALATTERQKQYCSNIYLEIENLAELQETKGGLGFSDRRKFSRRINKKLNELNRIIGAEYNNNNDTKITQVRHTLHRDCEALSAILQKLPGLRFFEKMFSLWHIVHIPIFILMIGSAIVHILVVHMY